MNCEKIDKVIQNFIKNKVQEAKLNKVVVGLSGGIDSSLSATLAVDALGKENVIGVMIPKYEEYRFNF